MRITEINSKNVKIIYKPSVCQLKAGDFVSLKEGNLTIITQVITISVSASSPDYNQADLSFLLSSKLGQTAIWAGELVSGEAAVEKTPVKFIEEYINKSADNFITIGSYSDDENTLIKYNFNNFTTPSVVIYDKQNENLQFTANLLLQLSRLCKKIVIIDLKGNIEIEGANKIIAGFQDKLPLNAEFIENISSKILEGISADSKIIIEDILFELAQYAKEIPQGFISISQLINVLDALYKKSKIAQLILLKNKLRRYQRNNIFAEEISEITKLKQEISENTTPLIYDLSNVPFEWQGDFIKKLINPSEGNNDFYLYASLDEKTFNSEIINYLLFKSTKNGIKPIISIDYKFVAKDTILEFCQNLFIYKSVNLLKNQPILNELIQSLPDGHFLTYGNLTSFIPICSFLSKQNATLIENSDLNETLDILQDNIDVNSMLEPATPDTSVNMTKLNTALSPEPKILLTPTNRLLEEPKLEIKQEKEPVSTEVMPELVTENTTSETSNQEPESVPEEPIIEPKQETIEEISNDEHDEQINNEQVIALQEEPLREEIAEIQEPESILVEPPVESQQEIIEEISDISDEQIIDLQEEPLQEEIAEIQEQEAVPEETLTEPEQETVIEIQGEPNKDEQPDELTSVEQNLEDVNLDDLDFSEEISQIEESQNSDDELLDILEDNGIEEIENVDVQDSELQDIDNFEDITEDIEDVENYEQQPQKSLQPSQKLPVYSANDYNTQKDNTHKTDLQVGDLIKHNKYGLGTVTKLTTHGEKVLCHINFEDFGRRLLDPEISQLEKIE